MSLLRIKDLNIVYYTLSGPVKAVVDASLEIEPGEWVSIVGESGSGKSTLVYGIMRLIPPPGRIVSGSIIYKDTDLAKLSEKELRRIRGPEIGMIFQDPMTSLDPLRRIGDQIAEALLEHGIVSDKEEALERAKKALKEVGIPENRINSYPHQLSGGQRQRVLIAAAVALQPKILIADEPTTALDVVVQAKIMDLLEELKRKYNMTIILITHDIALAAERSTRIVVMYAGRIVEDGPVDEIVNDPKHPYTEGLLESTPDLWGEKEIKSIPGNPPDLRNPPPGCPFHPRCPKAMKVCRESFPAYTRLNKRRVACHLYK
ncbi:MAG: ABC transporter ATP-binding protein [Desulfurococcales archaeon]|nr:ABC transporter ATP-binding protein [Desulfurococcales archaeon]MEB3789495.1 ABC transporter ATP-binding protein [Desulfurococcales archaeon]